MWKLWAAGLWERKSLQSRGYKCSMPVGCCMPAQQMSFAAAQAFTSGLCGTGWPKSVGADMILSLLASTAHHRGSYVLVPMVV